jgi:hypothetical protein
VSLPPSGNKPLATLLSGPPRLDCPLPPPPLLRALTPLMAIPGMISLGGGLPNPSTFPFQVLNANFEP